MKEPKLYRFLRPILTFLIIVVFRPRVIRKANIPTKGRIVLAGTHTNILDPVLLLSQTKRTIHFLAKKELVDGPLGFGFKNMGIIPVNRKIKDKSVMPAAEKYLNHDKVIGVFPEGTTEKGRGLLPFKTGAVRMAYSTDSEIIPFAIVGKYNPFKRLTLIFGDAYLVSGDTDYDNKVLRDKVKKLIKDGENYGKNK